MALPSGYKRLEYIQSSGTQYVDSGFIPNQDTRLEMMCSPLSVVDANDGSGFIPYGAGESYTSRAFECYTANSQYEFNYDGQYGFIGSPSTGQNLSISHNKNEIKLIIDGRTTLTKSFNYQSFTAPYTMTLFAIHRSSVIRGLMKLYACQIYDNGTLIRDYIPCQTTAGEVGLWDDVNEVFYGNAGTGTFTAGPEVGVDTPENFRLSSSTETTAMLAWDAVDGATGYKLYRDGILIATLTGTSYTDAIQPFTPYVYTLTAYNDSGESDPATISVQIIIPPEAPSNFRASSASMAAISLAWDSVTGAESYQLSRDGVVIYTGEYPSYTDSGLTAETAYTYTLSAVNSAGSSVETTLEAATTKFVLVTDRTAADVNAGNDKGTYKASDLNRVGAAMNYVADRLKAVGYDPHISPKTDWKNGEWVTPADQAVYLGDLAELRKQFALLYSTPEVPPRVLATGINTNDGLTHTWANNIEQILEDIDLLLTNAAQAWFYSGDLFSGEV